MNIDQNYGNGDLDMEAGFEGKWKIISILIIIMIIIIIIITLLYYYCCFLVIPYLNYSLIKPNSSLSLKAFIRMRWVIGWINSSLAVPRRTH